VDRVLAEGGVRFSHLANTGSADHLIYEPLSQLAEMRQDAGLAEVVDQTNGRVLRGKTLTFDLAGNRVLTETTEGGRTWISLSQKDKDGRGLEPKIGH
jgi:lipopolysaccharide export system protein LptA